MLVDGLVTHRSPFVLVAEDGGGSGSLPGELDSRTSSMGRPIVVAERRPAPMTNGADGALRALSVEPTALTVATYVPGRSLSSVAEMSAVYTPSSIGGFPRFSLAEGAATLRSAPAGKMSRT